jgi:hypothetical protein
MKPKVKDVYEPFNSLVRLVGQYGMVEVLASLAGIAEMAARDQHDSAKCQRSRVASDPTNTGSGAHESV